MSTSTGFFFAGERRAAVLILTAFSQRDLIERARDAGALAYLVKPFQKADLFPAIEVALGRFNELKSLHEQATSLEEQLETRKVVDRAKGRLMDDRSMTEAAARGHRSEPRQRSTDAAAPGDQDGRAGIAKGRNLRLPDESSINRSKSASSFEA